MQIMIIEDDLTTRAILTRIVKRLWPKPIISEFQDVTNALEHFKQHGANLILLDLGLVGISGDTLISAVRKSKATVPIIVITSRADRNTVIMARTYRVDGYIIKPIKPNELLNRISEIMGLSSPTFAQSCTEGFTTPMDFVKDELTAGRVSISLSPGTLDALTQFSQKSTKNEQLPHLLSLITDPALTTRLLGIANTSPYAPESGEVINTATHAIDQIGIEALTNLANELSLYSGAVLTNDVLAERAQEFRQDSLELIRLLTTLRKYAEFDLNICKSACMLFRSGELTLLQILQRWVNSGRELTNEDCDTVLSGCSAEAAAKIKARWNIPTSIRMIIGATYALPQGGTLRPEIIAMRAAGLLFNNQHIHELDKLFASMSIPSERWDEIKQSCQSTMNVENAANTEGATSTSTDTPSAPENNEEQK